MGGTVTAEKRAVGARLELVREILGFESKTEFAAWLGIGEDTYRHYTEGRNRISDAICLTLKQRKGITSDWLLFGDPSGLPNTLFHKINSRLTMG